MYVPDNFVIDPNPFGQKDDGSPVGTLKILGNLQVEGTYDTLNTTVTQNNLEVVDKTITVGSGNTTESDTAILSAGLLIGGSTLSSGVLDPLASFTYNFDATVNSDHTTADNLTATPNPLYHSRHFKSTIPIRMVDGWRATHDNELITKAQLTENLTTGGGITYSGLAGIKFKVVTDQDDADLKLERSLINYDANQRNMLWVLNTNTNSTPLDFKDSSTGSAWKDADNNEIDICQGMNFYVHDPVTGWHSQV